MREHKISNRIRVRELNFSFIVIKRENTGLPGQGNITM